MMINDIHNPNDLRRMFLLEHKERLSFFEKRELKRLRSLYQWTAETHWIVSQDLIKAHHIYVPPTHPMEDSHGDTCQTTEQGGNALKRNLYPSESTPHWLKKIWASYKDIVGATTITISLIVSLFGNANCQGDKGEQTGKDNSALSGTKSPKDTAAPPDTTYIIIMSNQNEMPMGKES